MKVTRTSLSVYLSAKMIGKQAFSSIGDDELDRAVDLVER